MTDEERKACDLVERMLRELVDCPRMHGVTISWSSQDGRSHNVTTFSGGIYAVIERARAARSKS